MHVTGPRVIRRCGYEPGMELCPFGWSEEGQYCGERSRAHWWTVLGADGQGRLWCKFPWTAAACQLTTTPQIKTWAVTFPGSGQVRPPSSSRPFLPTADTAQSLPDLRLWCNPTCLPLPCPRPSTPQLFLR